MCAIYNYAPRGTSDVLPHHISDSLYDERHFDQNEDIANLRESMLINNEFCLFSRRYDNISTVFF